MTHNQYPSGPRRETNLLIVMETLTQLDLQQLISQVQLLTQVVLAIGRPLNNYSGNV
jgi:hypothetical protein